MQKMILQGVYQPQLIGVQGGTFDQTAVLGTVEPVAYQRVADTGKMNAQLMRAPGEGPQPQQGTAVATLQHLIL